MKVFLAGIIQGSMAGADIHDQNWREPIVAAITEHLGGAEIYCHYSNHPDSITYELPEIRRTFADGLAQASASDLLVAYVPSASMGTAIEMYEAARSGAVVLTISPLAANWVVRAYSDRVFPNVAAFAEFLATGELEQLLAARRCS